VDIADHDELIPHPTVLEIKKGDIFIHSGIYHSQQLYHSRLLLFEIITATIQDGGSLISDHNKDKSKPSSKLKRLDTRHNEHRPWKGTDAGSMCVRLETKLKCPEYNMKLCGVSLFEVCHN